MIASRRTPKQRKKVMGFKDYVIATRPWSWTASVIHIWLTATLLSARSVTPVLTFAFAETLVMGICVQSMANLVNSYFDFKTGVDTKKSAGDRSLVDSKISLGGSIILACTLLAVASGIVLPKQAELGKDLLLMFAAGVGLAISYTATPFALKYKALGDITIIFCFGPLLMLCASLLMSGEIQTWILPYSIPVALLTEAILHANNTRDIHLDSQAGIVTLANLIGFRWSRLLYMAMVVGAYVSALLLWMQFKGTPLVLLSLPIALGIFRDLQPKTMHNMDERTAQLHMLFGLLLNVGIKIST